ncbi:MAG: hypothetical protein JJU40_08945 [Rhodobacteraceae bacterium]|nr:hypothetical protein [Paracoccaceae bacterium]
MLRLFGLFGKSAAMNALDDALRVVGVHPLLVPEAVKLMVIRLHKRGIAPGSSDAEVGDSAELLAFCMLGRDDFVESNSASAADRAEQRLEAAIAAGDSRDAKLVLLALHAGIIAPDIAEYIDVEDR